MSTYSSGPGAPDTSLNKDRKRTEELLVKLCNPGGPLARNSPRATAKLYEMERDRTAFHKEFIERFISDTAEAGKDGLAAIFTAGPPGSGKSTTIDELNEDLSGYRRLDADEIKNILLEKALEEGIFADLLSRQLPDGRPILPNELAVLVHEESADLHNALIRRSMEDRVNVIVEGTFSWPGLVERYMGWLVAMDYNRLRIIDVEVALAHAQAQASNRWWCSRQNYFTNHDLAPLGGRFTPPSAIQTVYRTGKSSSSCNANAVSMFNKAVDSNLFDQVDLRVYIDGAKIPDMYSTQKGQAAPVRPEPLILNRLTGTVSEGM